MQVDREKMTTGERQRPCLHNDDSFYAKLEQQMRQATNNNKRPKRKICKRLIVLQSDTDWEHMRTWMAWYEANMEKQYVELQKSSEEPAEEPSQTTTQIPIINVQEDDS
ncbi:DgyrCDS2319 [Dimorphilus gyrociliatus]|uniref:DgyrCDS2319 n=1 Tax=Dimorphilus gyrociliatus TaxID=2664684 RepID=A0A7I8V9X1_9ANNE|nr:DgyrCDS2319 [Dimorphilus gyrociliatus]